LDDRPAPDPATKDRTARLLLLLVVVAGAALRLYGLDAQSLWNDELSSWERSHHESLSDVIAKGVRTDVHPPGYQILVYGVMHTIGDSEIALRLPSAIAGVLAIAAIYALGLQLYTRREALIAATLLAFSYQPLYYSQEGRAYSLLLLLAILTAHFWFRVTRRLETDEAPELSAQVGYVLSAAAACYLHYFGLLLVAVQLVGWAALCVARPRALGRVALLAALVALAYAPWLPYLLEEFGREETHLAAPALNAIPRYWRFLFYNPGEHLKWFALAIFALAAGLSLAERVRSPRRSSLREALTSNTALLIAWLVVPFVIAYARSQVSLPIITHRNLIISLPAAFLLFSRAITICVRSPRLQAVTVGAMVAVMLYGLFVTGRYYELPRKEQFREAARVVALHEHEYPNATVIAHAWSKGRFDYYLERLGADSRVDLKAGAAEDVDRLRRHLADSRPDHVWFLLGHFQPEEPFMRALDEELELVFHVPLYEAFVRLYRTRPAPPR
jgi:mannosyltransferase